MVNIHTEIKSHEVLFFQALFTFLISSIFAMMFRINLWNFKQDVMKTVIYRSLCGALPCYILLSTFNEFWKYKFPTTTFAFFCNFDATEYISISKMIVLYFAAPLFVPFLAKLIANENYSKWDVVAILLGFIGIVIINYNELFMVTNEYSIELLGACIALIGGLSAATDLALVRKVSSVCHPFALAFYASIASIAFSAILHYSKNGFEIDTEKYSSSNSYYVLISWVMSSLAQNVLILAYSYEKASRIAVFSYLQPVLLIAYDYFIFSKQIQTMELLGSALIIGWIFCFTLLSFSN